MSMVHVAGTTSAVETGVQKDTGDKDALLVFVEGPYSVVKAVDPAAHVPSGYTLEGSHTVSTGDGGAKMTIRCVNYGTDTATTAPFKTTWRIEMAEVTKNLYDHPTVRADKEIILKWLATDANKRVDGNTYQYEDANGQMTPIANPLALKYIAAYFKGIETYNEYYPIVQKISYWKRLPGGTMNGKSTTGGTVSKFSKAGCWDSPSLSINGYASSNFFKSGDDWQEDNNQIWTQTEEWTWTPEKDNDTSWIYAEANS